MRKLIFVLCLFGFLVSSSQAMGYVINKSRTGNNLHWPDSKLPVAWYLNMNGYTRVAEADALKAMKDAVAQWTSPSCTKFRAVYKGKTTKGKSTSDRVNVFTFGSLGVTASSTTAKTYYVFLKSGVLLDADIVFRTSKPWSVTPGARENDLRGTAAHEVGHFLGLGHSSTLSATMYKSGRLGPSPRRTIDPDDVKGVCANYPQSGQSGNSQKGESCGTGNLCASGLLCVGKDGGPSYCFEPCQSGACPNGGKCLKTSTGNSYCACDSASDCNSNQTCTQRNCTPGSSSKCTKDADCPSNTECKQGTCSPKSTPPGKKGDLCGKSINKWCETGHLCVGKSGQPLYCFELCQNGTCPNGGKCLQTTSGKKFCACDNNSDCKPGQTCMNRNCKGQPLECTTNNDCQSGQECTQNKCVTKQQQPKGFGETCQKNSECTGKLCAGNAPQGGKFCTSNCAQNSGCPAGYTCTNEICQTSPSPTNETTKEPGVGQEKVPSVDASSPSDSPNNNPDKTEENREEVGNSGCQCSQKNSSDLALLLLVCLFFLFRRKQKLTS